MSKIYFEMNDAEKVFHHIAHDLEWAQCMLAEGFLYGTEEIRMDEEEFHEFYREAEDHIEKAYRSISKLLRAVEEPDDGDALGLEETEESDFPLRYHEIEKDEELKVLTGLTLVSRMREKFGDGGDGTDFTFKEIDGVRMINFFVVDDGGMYLSDWY